MYLLPVVFFLLLFVLSYKRKGIDLGGYIIAVYVISCATAVYLHNLSPGTFFDDFSFNISVIPTLLYCFLIGIAIYPFYKINTNRKRKFRVIANVKYFNHITYFFIIIFFFLLVFLWDDIVYGILQQNFADLREEMHRGELSNSLTRQTSIAGKLLGYGAANVGMGSVYMIPFFFYSICFTKNKNWHNILILISSLSSIIMGIIVIDRSCVIRWVLLFLISFFLFRPYLDKTSKNLLKKSVLLIGGVLTIYFVAVTISRFTMLEGGNSGGLLSYIGQPYLNFCRIWDNVDIVNYTTRKIFPTIDAFFIHTDPDIVTYKIRNINITNLNGFYSYIGQFYLDMGALGAIIIPILMAIFTNFVCTRIRMTNVFSLHEIIYLFVLSIIPTYGVIAYFYCSSTATMNLFLILLLMSKFKYSKIECTI